MASTQLVAKKLVPAQLPLNPEKTLNELTETEKMMTGQLYWCDEPALLGGRLFARDILRRYNSTVDPVTLQPCRELLEQLLGTCPSTCYITPPFQCDYGSNIHLGETVYMNFNCVLLDAAEIRIGDNVFLAPGVQLYTATHPVDPITRRTLEFAKPITIGRDCWLGGNSIVLPGITIGDGTIIFIKFSNFSV